MVVDLAKWRTDTISLISDFAEVVVIASLSTSFSDSGFTNTNSYSIITQSGANTISVDFQSTNMGGRSRYVLQTMGLNAIDVY